MVALLVMDLLVNQIRARAEKFDGRRKCKMKYLWSLVSEQMKIAPRRSFFEP